MNSFFDLCAQPPESHEEYVRSIRSHVRSLFMRLMIQDLFVDGHNIIQSIRLAYTPKPDMPNIMVRHTNEIDISGIEGAIYVSHGFLEHCVGLSTPPLSRLIERGPNEPNLPISVPNPLFCWSLAHEYAHGLRRHSLATERFSSSAIHQRATEIDADLVAAAGFFRWAQRELLEVGYSNLTIRMIVFACLFWALRSLWKLGAYADGYASDTHPPFCDRLYHVTVKLAQLTDQMGEPMNPSAATPESLSLTRLLFGMLPRLESEYKLQNAEDCFDVVTEMIDFVARQGWNDFTVAWDDLRVSVSVCSGTNS